MHTLSVLSILAFRKWKELVYKLLQIDYNKNINKEKDPLDGSFRENLIEKV